MKKILTEHQHEQQSSHKELWTPPSAPAGGYVRMYAGNDSKMRFIKSNGEDHGIDNDMDSFGIACRAGEALLTAGFKSIYRVKKKMRITGYSFDSFRADGAPVASTEDVAMSIYRNGSGTPDGQFLLPNTLSENNGDTSGFSNTDYEYGDILSLNLDNVGGLSNILVTIYFISL